MSPTTQRIKESLKRRHRAEQRFRFYGIAALAFAGVMLATLLMSVVKPGLSGFTRHELRLEIDTMPYEAMLKQGKAKDIDWYLHTNAIARSTLGQGPKTNAERQQLYRLLGFFAADNVKRQVLEQPEQWHNAVTVWVPLSDIADLTLKGVIDRNAPHGERPISDEQLRWLDAWEKDGRIRNTFNSDFFISGDSRAPEAAGLGGAIMGSLWLLVICMAVALPVAIMAAIYLEEFSRKTRFSEWLEVVINNLAAVPSIIYGLLGLSVFLQFFGMPRSSPLVGGLTLALLVLPVMIIAARAAIRAVPPSMRQAAAGLGASPIQVVRHHVLPYAMPGIMTGTILSFCRAIGETAPLLMIGMVAFVADAPQTPLEAATALPVQIYLWASSPELGYVEKTSAGILVLLVLLLILNAAAITIRRRMQLTWT
jgi:phosphate transport system permease protein